MPVKHFTTGQVAEMLSVTPDKVTDWIADGSLAAVNVARHSGGKARWRIAAADLEDFLRRRRTQPPAPAPRGKRRTDPQTTRYY
jgi:excisionase family DNA binding protein